MLTPQSTSIELEVRLLSGEVLANVIVEPSWTTTDLQQALSEYLQLGTCLTALLDRETLLKDDETMAAAGLVTGTVLQAVVEFVPVLHCFQPCAARELSERRGCHDFFSAWLIDHDSVDHLVADKVQHCGIDSASEASREIVAAMVMAAPSSLEKRMLYYGPLFTSMPDSAEIIVISNPGPDPMQACIRALALINDCLTQDGSVIQIHECVRVTDVDFNTRIDIGFNVPERGRAEGVIDPELVALTGIMAERLNQHFQFELDERILCAPVIYGGYTSDGSIVGVLSGRVALERIMPE